MLRPLFRVLISRHFVAAMELVIVVPLVLGIWEVSKALWAQPDLHEQVETLTGLGIIMIALGVVLEERRSLREVFGLLDGPDEVWEEHLVHSCHLAGVGQLVLGLFAEIFMELTKIPNSVIYTGDVDDWLLAGGCIMIGIGAMLLLRHAIVLIMMSRRHPPH